MSSEFSLPMRVFLVTVFAVVGYILGELLDYPLSGTLIGMVCGVIVAITRHRFDTPNSR